MSRIEQAWQRATGTLDSTALAERVADDDNGGLQRYPVEQERVASRTDRSDLLAHRTIAAPRMEKGRQLGALPSTLERKLVTSRKASPVAVEQYRRLAGALHELQVERGLKTLMVTSAVPGEGKTLTVANLALTFSEACKRRVLLIDADLRRPCVHDLFRLTNSRGLTDVLSSEGNEIPLLQQVSEHLSVLAAGRAEQPMAALTSDRMRVFLDQCAATFDWVLLDAAPVGFMPDAALLARVTRAVLLVIAAHSTPHPHVSRAMAELDPECVVGTLLNGVAERNIPALDYYQDYYRHDTSVD